MSFAPIDLPADLPSFVALLQARAELQGRGEGGSFTFLGDDLAWLSSLSEPFSVEGRSTRWDFADLDRKARAIASDLQGQGLAGERALLLYPPGLDFLAAFFGCLYAGVVAVPAYLPRSDRALPRLRGIVADSTPRAVLTTGSRVEGSDRWFAAIPELSGATRLATDTVVDDLADRWRDPGVGLDSLAFLQYTSGSTSTAKGVMVSHGNLLSNSATIQRGFGSRPDTRGVSWLPLHHDMGLIGGALQVLYCGGSTTLFSPVAFLQRPVRWLELISRTGASISGGPNFAYDLCARRVTAEQKVGLDLGGWTVAFNGAEPIRPETIDRFVEAFAPCGFRREAFLPCYGLAEATLIVSGGPPSLPPAVVRVENQAFERGEVLDAKSGDAKSVVGSGQVADDHRVAIVDPDRLTVQPDHRIGEIWVAGPGVAQGYWNQPEATEATFQAGLAGDDSPGSPKYLRTGDLGFVRDGQLFVTGRLKDLIIIRGRNIYPQDVEWAVGRCHDSLADDAWAAFAVEVDGEERLVLVGEVDRRTKVFEEAMGAIRSAVASEFDLDLHAITLLKPMTLPRTSSGKVRRREIRGQFLDGTLGGVASWVADPTPASAPARRDHDPVTISLQSPGQPASPTAAAIADWLVVKLAGPLGVSAREIDVTRPFASFGLGSLRAVALVGELEEWIGRPLSPTLLYEYPTVEALSRHLAADSVVEPQPTLPLRPVPDDDWVAIIGVACRFPGASGPEAYWKLLSEGVDAVGPVSAGRQADFAAPPGTQAGFLDRVDLFDAEFFGIAPREAVWVDPQQRLLLEVAWEALEDGGQVVDRLAGTSVGVFVGISTDDYARLHHGRSSDAYALTGNAASIAANRLSYTFDFRGPSLAVDTACSSSLVAIQLACRSLLAGESTTALAGGVNLILAPELLADFASAGFLASDARCKTFDASADGYVRGEGAGMVVLKPLARAIADGDPIRAVIRGGAINQDGRSNGLTAPSREAQEAVLRSAYRTSGVEPGQVDYVEAHGTGTLLGDPIEARALGAVLAEGRPEGERCWVGSAKTNIGHLEAAAGVAGVIKAALALEHGVIPPSLHFDQPNPHIPFDALPIAIARELTPWPRSKPTRLAGVSSFGFGGTNAHVVLEAAERVEAIEDPTSINRSSYLLPISAKTGPALASLARSIRDRLASGGLDLADAAFSSGTRRSHLEHRLAVVAGSAVEAVELLDAAERGEALAGLVAGRAAPGRRPKLAFVFSGQGSQWLGMGRDLLAVEPVFRSAVEGVDRLTIALGGWSVLAALMTEGDDPRLLEPEIAQPTQFAVHVGLAAVWRSWGIEPDAVVGHSLGEAAAAYVAGAISLGDAVRLVMLRGCLTQRAIGLGRTVAAGLSSLEAYKVADASEGRISVAAINGPTSTTLSGDPDSIIEQFDDWTAEGTFARLLNVDVAFHSPQMDPLAAELAESLVGLRAKPTAIPMVSTVTGHWVDGQALDPAYWGRNLRETVQFAAAAETLAAEGFDTFLEIGPHPSLVASIQATLRESGREGFALGSIRRGSDGPGDLLRSLAALYARGASVRWSAVTPTGRFVRLPSYPWQRERFWAAAPPAPARQVEVTANGSNGHHPTVNGSNGHHAVESDQTAPQATLDSTSDLLYEVAWRPVEGSNGPVRESSSTGNARWVIFEDGGGVGHRFRVALEARGGRCVSVFRSGTERPSSPIDGDRVIDDVESPALRSTLDELAVEPIAGLISFWSLDAPTLDPASTSMDGLFKALELGCGGTLALAQALEAGPTRGRLTLVTAGAQAVGAGRSVENPAQATVWGLGRSIRWDRPDAWGGLVDLDPDDLAGSVAGLLDAILDPEADDEQAIRSGQRFAGRLVRSDRPSTAPDDRPAPPIRPDSTYLVTGGLGDLGLKAAGWLVDRGARRLILVGRRGLPARSEWGGLAPDHPARSIVEAIEAMERQGATVVVAAADVADEPRMKAVLTRVSELLPPIRGIIHAAGVVGPASLRDTSPIALARVLRPKVAGTWVLHRLARGLPLDFFVPFSSIAAVLGTREVAYAAANQFLDAYASWASSRGVPATSVGWGPWAGVGMASSLTKTHKLLGLEPLASDRAFRALEQVLGGGPNGSQHRVVADVDWFTFGVIQGKGKSRRFFEGIDERPRFDADGDGPARNGSGLTTSALELWRDFPADQRREQVIAYFRNRVAGVLRLDPSRVDPERKLDALGLDSLMAIELKSGVEADLGTSLPITRLLEGPTIAQLADQAIEQWDSPETANAGPTASAPGRAEDVGDGLPTRHPLSPGQRSLWLVHQRMPDDAAYNMAGAAKVRGRLDVPALRRSLQALVDRHASLRTTFALSDLDGGEPEQIVDRSKSVEVGFSVVDASGWPDDALNARLSEEARRPFDLSAAPPFRTTLFSRDGTDHHIVLSAHHIIGDFWSIALLMHELGALYAADRAGAAPPVLEPELRYTDFVRWQKALLAGPEGDRLRSYWGGVLAGPLPVLDLAADRPRPSVRTHRGASRNLTIDPALTAHLVALGAGSGASLYVTLLAAFQVLLARMSGQTDIIVGSPVAGRDRAHLTDVVGYFANPLPIRSDLADDPTFADFLVQVRRAVFDGLEHQDLPFASMAEQFGGGRDPSRSPIFQAMFVFQKAQKLDDAGLTPFVLQGEGSKLALGDFALESVAIDLAASQFELTLATAETEAGLMASLEYNTDLFDASTADRVLARFETLLRSIVADPTRRLSHLDVLPRAEWDQVVVAPNRTEVPFPGDVCIHRVIEAQAERTPDAVAVIYRDIRLTYRELNARANQLARHLRTLGVGPESRVGLGVERSADMVVGILAILKAGGAYVPLDPGYPRERLAYLLGDSGVAVLVTQDPVCDRMPSGDARVIRVDSDLATLAQYDSTNLEGGADPGNAAYIIYTSGSTGRPKGVVVSHRNLMHSTYARVLHYKRPVGTYLLLASFAHDTSVAGLFWSLIEGGRVVVPVQGSHADPEYLTRIVAEHQVTHWDSVPSLLRVVLAEAPRGRMDSLQVIFLGGEACPHDLPGLAFDHIPGVEFHNEYGPTEATVWATVHVCRPDEPKGAISIGRPIANTEIYILDPHLQPSPIGVAGEIYIGGEGVTRGYFDRPGLTADRFAPNPFAPEGGGRMYRTGDLARWRADGSIDFLGRIDQQVKVRGYRIELGEVEAALNGHPGLADAVAVAREDQPGDVRLVAYFVANQDGPAPTPSDLRRWLKERLPDSLVPTLFVPLDALPASANGKVDRQALPKPDGGQDREGRDEPIVAPRNAAETTLERLAATILGRDVVSIHDDFFDLGIDSIRAIQLVSRARQAGLGLDPAQVFDHPTVASLAGVATSIAARPDTQPESSPRGRSDSVDVIDEYPLSPMQEAMLFHSASNPGLGMYVQQFEAPIASKLHIPAFEAAWREVIARHPVLRTSIQGWDEGRGRQVVHARVPLPLEHRDWSHLDPGAAAERLAAFLEDDRSRGFDPTQAPLLRLTLIRTGASGFRLVLSNHHALMDGWCAPIILGEVLACYEANREGRPANLPPTRPFRDYIDWLKGVDPSVGEAFWGGELRGFREPTPIPLASNWSAIRAGSRSEPGERSVVVPSTVVNDLSSMARRHRLTLSTVIAGAWALVLGRHSGRDDVVFGVTVSGRPAELPGVESMVGLFINTLPARVELVDAAPLSEWLTGLQGKLVGLRRHQSTPLSQIQRRSDVPRGRPLFETIVVFENTPDDPTARDRAERLGVGPLSVFERTNFPLALTVVPGDHLTLTARFDADRIDGASVDRLFDHLNHLLGEMADNPDAPLAELTLADPSSLVILASPGLDDEDGLEKDDNIVRRLRNGADASQTMRLDGLSDEEVDALLAEITSAGGVRP